MTTARPWREAWHEALYGPSGFFVHEAPRDHFRTSVTGSTLVFAGAVLELARRVDDALGRPDPFDLVDVGGGRGELLAALPATPARWRLTAVERAPDPGVPGVRWLRGGVPPVTGLLVANEWLDAVPLDVVESGRVVLVDGSGAESPGDPADPALLAWADRWWPDGGRVEVGLTRDLAWAAATRQVRRGLAVAVDYGHVLSPASPAARPSGSTSPPRATPDAAPWSGRRATLTGYRRGREVAPVPDGGRDLTAHVALDSCAAAGRSRLLDQRTALRALGVDGALPVWQGDGAGYGRELQAATQARALLDPAGLGGFGWLVTPVGIEDPLAEPAR